MAKKPIPPRPPPNARPKNHLLRALPEADFRRLRPDLKTISTPSKHVFHRQNKLIEFVYFPNGGVASVTAVLSDGTLVETATVGTEGLVGLEAFFLKDPTSPGETMMQVPDTNAEQLPVEAFRREVARQGIFSALIGRYARSRGGNVISPTGI